MSLTLAPATEQRIQEQLAHGKYATPDELIEIHRVFSARMARGTLREEL